MYPLRFHPVFRQYIWGGRRLGSVFGKPIGEGDDYAESWEVVDHGNDQSVVREGDLTDKTLNELVANHTAELLGDAGKEATQFPLLLKLLDCNRDLSIQVHPNDQQASQLEPPDLGKTEAWYILDADPGAKLYVGLREGVDANQFEAAVADGSVADCMQTLSPAPGQAILIPAGTVHALGSGLLVAEIQQSSDTTYRLFDWNRLGADGQPRPLHVGQGLAVTDWDSRPQLTAPQRQENEPSYEQLIRCDRFTLCRRTLDGDPIELPLGGSFRILLVIEGEIELRGDPLGPLTRGQSVLLPACLEQVTVWPKGRAIFLEMGGPTA